KLLGPQAEELALAGVAVRRLALFQVVIALRFNRLVTVVKSPYLLARCLWRSENPASKTSPSRCDCEASSAGLRRQLEPTTKPPCMRRAQAARGNTEKR